MLVIPSTFKIIGIYLIDGQKKGESGNQGQIGEVGEAVLTHFNTTCKA